MITDHELLVGLFNAVGALAERLTGDRMTVELRDSNGHTVQVYASSYPSIDWVPGAVPVHEQRTVFSLVESSAPKLDDSPNPRNATPKSDLPSSEYPANR
jgi:hypothetical protein